MTWIHFQEFVISVRVIYKKDGKRRQRTERFSQTLNPFNKTLNGAVKTEKRIRYEVGRDAEDCIRSEKAKGNQAWIINKTF